MEGSLNGTKSGNKNFQIRLICFCGVLLITASQFDETLLGEGSSWRLSARCVIDLMRIADTCFLSVRVPDNAGGN